ncbi:MAG TPA: hypothetical protein VGL81_29475 [Polyangiaceae bacterium]|jgi:hypothetical protein
MVERDVIVAKAATIERCLARVAEVRRRAPGALLPIDVEDIVVLNVTRAAQAAADLAAHVVAAEGSSRRSPRITSTICGASRQRWSSDTRSSGLGQAPPDAAPAASAPRA